MKNLKKILAVLLAAAMVFVMGITVFAEPQDTTLKVTPVTGHTYTAYQLFVGDLGADGSLSNVKWGTDAAPSITYGDKTVTPVRGEAVPQAVLDYLGGLSGKTTSADGVAQATADIISAWVTGTGTEITDQNTTVLTGYYVIKDAYTNSTDPHDTTLSTVVCEVVGPTTVTPKAGTTTHKKEVLDVNDSTEAALVLDDLIGIDDDLWATSADHDFGDHVPFKLTTTIASDFAKYNSYYLQVKDTLGGGLKLDQNSIKVYVNGELATEGTAAGQYSVTKAEKSFTVTFTKLNGNANAAAGRDVVVVYTATLDGTDADVVIGGNPNESSAVFSNNPNGDQTGTGETPPSTVVVFTYKTIVNKVQPDAEATEENATEPLAGAEFTLTKILQDGSSSSVAVLRFDEDGHPVDTASTATTPGNATSFQFNGLDDGVYTLTETVTPNGYNTIDPITFMIVADHSTSTPTLSVKNEDGTDFTGTVEFTANGSQLSTDVLNQKGTILPSTGGIGTTIFYIIGGVIVLAAVIILVIRSKKSSAK